MEAGNDDHRTVLVRSARCTSQVITWTKVLNESLHVPIPPCALSENWGPFQLDDSLKGQQTSIRDAVTNGLIRVSDATRVVYWLASTLKVQDDRPLLEHRHVSGQHLYDVHLPLLSKTIRGSPSDFITQARRSACFRMCQELQDRGILDSRFYKPVNMYAEINDNKSHPARQYPFKTASFWSHALSSGSTTVYPMLVRPQAGNYTPVVLLTARPLPALLPFNLYPSGQAVQMNFLVGTPFEVTGDQLDLLHRYTLRAFRTMVNKHLICEKTFMPYFIAPYEDSSLVSAGSSQSLAQHISWTAVERAANTWATPLTLDDLKHDLTGVMIQDRALEFTKRYFVCQVRKDLSPLSQPAVGSVRLSPCRFCHLLTSKFRAKRAFPRSWSVLVRAVRGLT
jgi:endoribonuclease Dicer